MKFSTSAARVKLSPCQQLTVTRIQPLQKLENFSSDFAGACTESRIVLKNRLTPSQKCGVNQLNAVNNVGFSLTIRKQVISYLFVSLLLLILLSFPGVSGASKTRVVNTKYGSVQGFIRPLGHLLGDIEVFLGVPYASAPVEDGRFTPTNSPTPWDKVRDATQQPPVCPQILPDVDNSMADERATYIRRIRPFLLNQSEDCLTLSIYSPILVIPGSEVYPVVVYLHGESFSWGAGSLYDGSVLAAYGRVVVVTINYRLGPLGFLNSYPGEGSAGVASNFALLDQIAALSWLVDNIGHFHGDRNKVTLVGRDTGAACITYLMESPVMPPGLFHRAVLLSGGSWCPWASVHAPLSNTIKLALTLDCPVPEDRTSQFPPTVACLRRVPLSTLMAAARTIVGPTFTPAWGPSVDGVVVAPDIRGKHSHDLLLGFTPWEGWSWLPHELHRGVDNSTFVRIARTLVRNTRRHHLKAVLAAAVQEYTDWSVPSASDIVRRDALLKMLGDAMLVAPLHRAADAYSTGRKVFVFMGDVTAQLNSQFQLPGWELGLLWGSGLSDSSVGLTPEPPLPGPVLAQLSEDLITLVTNFAKSGDPNLPRESPSPGFAAIAWPAYQPDTRRYLRISVPPSIGSQYRAHQLALWSWLIPELEAVGEGTPHRVSNDSWELSDDPVWFYGAIRPVDPWAFLDPKNQNKSGAIASGVAVASTTDPTLSDQTSHLTTTLALSPTIDSPSSEGLLPAPMSFMRYSTALLATLGMGTSLLLLNAIIFGLIIWRRPRRSQQAKLNTRQPQLQSVSGGLNEDASLLSMMTVSQSTSQSASSAMTAGQTAMTSSLSCPGEESPQSSISSASYPTTRYTSIRKSNLKKKQGNGSLGVLPEYVSSSCDKLCHGRPSILKSSSSTHHDFYKSVKPNENQRSHDTLHQIAEVYSPSKNMILYSCQSPASSIQSSSEQNSDKNHFRQRVEQQQNMHQQLKALSSATLCRRQSIPCLPVEDESGRGECSRTLPRHSDSGSRQRLKESNESLRCSRESCSSSMFNIPSSKISENQNNFDDSHRAVVQPNCAFRSELSETMEHSTSSRNINRLAHISDTCRSNETPQNISSPRHSYQTNEPSDGFAKQQDELQKMYSQRSFSPVSSFLRKPRPVQSQVEDNETMSPFEVLPACPPEFQNETQPLEVPDPPPPPRISAHAIQQHKIQQNQYGNNQHQPSTSTASTIPSTHLQHQSLLHQQNVGVTSHQQMVIMPPPHTSTHQQFRPRQGEKRVTIIEEGVHKL